MDGRTCVISKHAKLRIQERAKDNNSKDLLEDMKKAYLIKNYLVRKNPAPNRVTVYFSSNRKFLWKVILSTETGTVVTVLPLTWNDIEYAIEKGIVDRKNNN